MTYKLCPKCRKQPAVIYRGYVYKCRECQKAFMQQWYLAHRTEQVEKQRANYVAKRASICARERERYAADPKYRAHKQAINAATVQRNPEKARQRAVDYYRRNREQRIAYALDWRRKNADKATEYNRRHRARRRNAPICDLTHAEWDVIKGRWHHRCAYCGKQRTLTQDHVEPTSRGGSHTAANVVPACGPCNSSKGNRFLLEWVLIAA